MIQSMFNVRMKTASTSAAMVWLWWLLCALPLSAWAVNPLPLNQQATQPERHLMAHTAVFQDTTRHLSLTQALAQPESDWTLATGAALRLGYADAAWWLRVGLHNDTAQDRRWLLQLGWPLVDLLDVYVLKGPHVEKRWLTGDQRPFDNRPTAAPDFVFPLDIPAGETRWLVMRLELIDGSYDVIPLKLWEPDAYLLHVREQNLWLGAYLGLILALLVYSLLLFLSTRERTVLYYAGYLGSFGLWIIGFLGLGYQYLWTDQHTWNNLYGTGVAVPVVLLSTLYITHFLQTRERVPRLHRWIWGLAWLDIVPALAVVADTAGWAVEIAVFNVMHMALLVLLIPLTLLAAWRVWREGFKPARFFLLGWGCLFLGILLYLASQIPGLLPEHALISNSIVLGSVIEFMLLALAMGDRIRIMWQDKVAAEQEVMRLKAGQAAELERVVHTRTTELRDALQRIERLARTDELTGLSNRRAFNEVLPRELARAQRERSPLALCILDLDHFKHYNDRFGHQAGDDALRRLGQLLTEQLRRSGDFAFRLGGEEFALLLSMPGDFPRCQGFLEQLCAHVATMGLDHNSRMTASLGMAYLDVRQSASMDALVSQADEALYEAKRQGRNQVVARRFQA